jgi:hypothetical protein
MLIDDTLLQDNADPDKRLPESLQDAMVEHPGELYSGMEKEGESERHEESHEHSYKPTSTNDSQDVLTAEPQQHDEVPATDDVQMENPSIV